MKFVLLSLLGLASFVNGETCDTMYLVDWQYKCVWNLNDFDGNCTSFTSANFDYSHGMAVDPETNTFYISLTNGDTGYNVWRELMTFTANLDFPSTWLNIDFDTDTTKIKRYFADNSTFLAGLTYSGCFGGRTPALYGVTGRQNGGDDGSIVIVDAVTGDIDSTLASLTLGQVGRSIAYNPYDGYLYSMGDDLVYSTTGNALLVYQIDTQTGNVTITNRVNYAIANYFRALMVYNETHLVFSDDTNSFFLAKISDSDGTISGSEVENVVSLGTRTTNVNQAVKSMICLSTINENYDSCQTMEPSVMPSNMPSTDPSMMPSNDPTTMPSNDPSVMPTNMPLSPTYSPTTMEMHSTVGDNNNDDMMSSTMMDDMSTSNNGDSNGDSDSSGDSGQAGSANQSGLNVLVCLGIGLIAMQGVKV